MDGGFTRQDTVAYMSMPDRYYSFDRKGWHCVVLDGNDPSEPPQAGYARGVAANQRAWLAADLQGTDLPVLIFIHQSLDRGDVDGDREVLDILAAHNRKVDWRQVVAVFSGHHHLDYAVSIDGIWHVQINSMSNYWLGDDFKHVRYSSATDAAFPYVKVHCSTLRPTRTHFTPLYVQNLTAPCTSRALKVNGWGRHRANWGIYRLTAPVCRWLVPVCALVLRRAICHPLSRRTRF
jgi:hypothetical protein